MQIYFDFSYFEHLGTLSVPHVMWELFLSGGWIFFVFAFLQFLWAEWLSLRQDKFLAQQKWVLLAIDVPKDNEQSPKAVEHMMTNLAGAHMPLTKWEEWWEGAFQLAFSLEIVSIDGYIQFLIRTTDYWRDMVEAAVYAQYPEAEITEVEDYVDSVPDIYPNDDYDMWGSELQLVEHEAYPLRTYVDFEHTLTQEFKDPMASLLEMFSRLGKGEQAWFQIIVKPTDDSWKNGCMSVVNKLIGAKDESVKSGFLGRIFGSLGKEVALWAAETSHSLFDTDVFESSAEKREDQEGYSKMLYLSPGTRKTVELIERKMSKLGFYCKIRVIYVAKKEAFQKAKRVGTFFSIVKQYAALNANALKPSKPATTKAAYLFAQKRITMIKNKLMKGYKTRSAWRGMYPSILNIEELATLYHFPAYTVKAPLLKRTEAKKGEPPAALPLEEETPQPLETKPAAIGPPAEQPKRVQYLPDSLRDYNFDNDWFEQKFGQKKAAKQVEAKAKTTKDNRPPSNLPFLE